MSKGTKIFLGVLAIFFALIISAGVGLFAAYVNANDTAVRHETRLVALKQRAESVLANYGQKLQEAAQVPGMAKEDIVEIAKASIQSRYNSNSDNPLFNAVREHNPNADPELYRTLQRLTEAGRNEFQAAQDIMLDTRRAYENDLGSFWSGMFMRFAGFPKVDLTKFNPVSTDRAARAFETGKEDAPLKLR